MSDLSSYALRVLLGQTEQQRHEPRLMAVQHESAAARWLGPLRELFDSEYLQSEGPWDPDLPYGYAPHDLHVLAVDGDRVVGHVGWAGRRVDVGRTSVVVGGVGGMLVAPEWRGTGLGSRLLGAARRSMLDAGGIAFGYLGCREEVVGFYTTCGWHRISVSETWVDRTGVLRSAPPGGPILILPVGARLADWPEGAVDLRGRAW